MIEDLAGFYHNAAFFSARSGGGGSSKMSFAAILDNLKPEGYAQILDHLNNGATIGKALEGFVPKEDCIALDAADQAGRVSQALTILEKRHAVAVEAKRKIIKTATLPAIFFVVLFFFFIFVVAYLAPQVAGALDEINRTRPVKLPAYHEFIFSTSMWMHDNPAITAAIGIPAVLMVIVAAVTGYLWRFLSVLPLINPTVTAYQNSVLFSHLYMLVSASTGFNQALRALLDTVSSGMAGSLLRAAEQIESGEMIHNSVTGLFDDFAVKTIMVGEQTADLQEALKTLADWYQDNFDQAIGKLDISLQMTMLVTMAGFVGWAAYSFYYPIMLIAYELSGG
jgi:type IV pilus assembly protein PilC